MIVHVERILADQQRLRESEALIIDARADADQPLIGMHFA